MLGPKLLYGDDSLQHAGMYFHRDAFPNRLWLNQHYFKGFPRRYAPANVCRPVPAVTGACLMLQRELFENLGGWDESYVQGDYEDSDLCLRAYQRGCQNWYLPAAELYHLEGQSRSPQLEENLVAECDLLQLLAAKPTMVADHRGAGGEIRGSAVPCIVCRPS